MNLNPLLRPRTIAVIGASANPKRIGGIPIALLREAGFSGIVPVNPKYEEIDGIRCFPTIKDAPRGVDLALIAIPADEVLASLEDCHSAGVRSAMVFAAGFAETNKPYGIGLQAQLAAFSRRTGLRVAGPNCMGNANFHDGVFTTFGTSFRPGEVAGATALLTQSGNMSATIYRIAKRAGVAFSHVINTGNEVDVEFSDYLDFLSEDENTTSILCYIEELRDGPKFLRAARRLRNAGKLLAVYKVGSTEKGAEATRSHTAALAGDSAAYDAAFESAGVARAVDLAGLSDLAYLHQFARPMTGGGVAVMGISGAAGAILADALTLNGAHLPTLPQDIQAQLRERIPDFGMVTNPIDLTGNIVNASDFVFDVVELALRPPEIDVLMAYLPGVFLERTIDQLERAAKVGTKTIVAIDTFALADRARLGQAGVPVFTDFDQAARAVASYGRWSRGGAASFTASQASTGAWPGLPDGAGSFSETESKSALASFGVRVVQDIVANSAVAVAEAGGVIGYPLVLKLVSPDIVHKTEYGLVKLGIRDEAAAVSAYLELVERAKALPGVRIEGVAIEPMLAGGVELLVGVTRDAVFGWMMTVGLGGLWTELMGDVSHRLLPVDEKTAETMLRSLRGFALLDGYRAAPKADIAAASASIAALSAAVLTAPIRVREVEINPLLVMPVGRGATAVDALVLFTGAESVTMEPAHV